jgi:hypothetical protein
MFSACATREHVRWEDVTDAEKPTPVVENTSAPPPPPPAPPPPEPKPVVVTSTSPVTIEGKNVDDGTLVDMPALELVCIADARALTEPTRVQQRFDDVARKENISLGGLQFVRLLRDPARSVVDPPPRLCRTLAAPAELKAPLEREREPASRWIVVQIKTSLSEDAARVALLAQEKNLSPTSTPRVLLDDEGKPVGVAIPGGA